MIEIVVSVLVFAGLFFILAGVIGLLRFPDVYTRMHATGLMSTLGIACILAASFIHFNWIDNSFSIKELLILVFLFLTCPVSTHMLIQAAYKTKTDMCKDSVIDELKSKRKLRKQRKGRKG